MGDSFCSIRYSFLQQGILEIFSYDLGNGLEQRIQEISGTKEAKMKASKKLSFLLSYQLPVQTVAAYLTGFYYLSILIVFLAIPILDQLLGKDRSNPDEDAIQQIADDPYFSILIYLWVPVQLALLLGGAYVVSHENLSAAEYLACTFSIAILTGAGGITVAHELGHKSGRLEQALSGILLASVCYMHFKSAHNNWHHAHVATPEDPSSAKFRESYFHFLPRSVIGSLRCAWRLERSRLLSRNLPVVGLYNPIIWQLLIVILSGICFYFLFGWKGALYFYAQSFLAISLLEIINYIQHYGLRRKEAAPGKYEPITAAHSWNSMQFLTNTYMINLERHSDHHLHAKIPYQVLRNHEDGPQLPFGYAALVPLVLLPPLWFRLMNPLVEQWNRREFAAMTSSD